MRWIKKGLLFSPQGKVNWASDSALQPTPLIINDEMIRVYCGMRDNNGVSRVGYVDLSLREGQLIVTSISKKPVLDVGLPGTFDDNGVVPSAIVRRDKSIFLYYAGYQLVKNVRFLVLGGLAISEDGGLSFRRYKNVPVLERTHEEFLFRVIHTIIYQDKKWKVWYGGGNHFETHGDRTLPVYDIRYMESDDGIQFPDQGEVVLHNQLNEHRVGRPYVICKNGKYIMFFGASTPDVAYRLSYATSINGRDWKRKTDLGLEYKDGDFDSNMSAYPSIIQLGGRIFMIYNGNEYGKHGFGYAELDSELWS